MEEILLDMWVVCGLFVVCMTGHGFQGRCLEKFVTWTTMDAKRNLMLILISLKTKDENKNSAEEKEGKVLTGL